MKRTKPNRAKPADVEDAVGQLSLSPRNSGSSVSMVSSQRLGSFVSQNVSFCISDLSLPDQPVMMVSSGFCETTGYAQEECLGVNCRFLQGAETDRESIKIVSQAINEYRECRVVVVNYRKNGEKFTNMLHLVPIISAGKCRYYLGVQSEIPEIIMTSQEKYAPTFPAPCSLLLPTFEITPEKVFAEIGELYQCYVLADVTLPDKPIVYASDNFYQMTGYTKQETIGKNCRFLQGMNTNSATVDKIRSAVVAGSAVTAHIYNYKKNGTPFWNMLILSPIRNTAGIVEYFVGVQVEVESEGVHNDDEGVVMHRQIAQLNTFLALAQVPDRPPQASDPMIRRRCSV